MRSVHACEQVIYQTARHIGVPLIYILAAPFKQMVVYNRKIRAFRVPLCHWNGCASYTVAQTDQELATTIGSLESTNGTWVSLSTIRKRIIFP
jgi:hypothetical protein